MCGGSKAPTAPTAVPEAAQAPTTADGSSETQADRDKRRRAAASGQGSSTILTGSRGVTESGVTTNKTLLGQ
jgi:hypothetical protein